MLKILEYLILGFISFVGKKLYHINFVFSLAILFHKPLLVLMWLPVFTAWLYAIEWLSWRSLAKAWLPILAVWYLILVFSFPEYGNSVIVIGGAQTAELHCITLTNKRFAWWVVIQTIEMLNHISYCFRGLKIVFYVPVVRYEGFSVPW